MDIRQPVGLLFMLVGALLVGYGLLADVPRFAGVNLDVVWGAVMGVSGLVLRWLAWRGSP